MTNSIMFLLLLLPMLPYLNTLSLVQYYHCNVLEQINPAKSRVPN